MKSTSGCSWVNDWFIRGLLGAVLIMIGALILFSCTFQARAQDTDGYYVTDKMPIPGMVLLDTKFWLTLSAGAHEETWLINVAGYVVWERDREPEYFLLRIDNLYRIQDWVDPLAMHPTYKPGLPTEFIPTEDLPPPTYLIWPEETLRLYVGDEVLPLE